MAYVSGRLAARCNRYCAVCLFQGKDIVYAVARHGNGVALVLYRAHQYSLLFGRHPAENGVAVGNVFHIAVVQPLKRNKLFCAVYACPARHFRYRNGIVARNNFYGHIVLFEPFYGGYGVLAYVVGNGNYRHGAHYAWQLIARYRSG